MSPAPARDLEIEVLYDGGCPLCTREVALLRRLDRGRGRVRCSDLAAPGFDASRVGRTRVELMARIHGVLPDGSVVEGMEVFRRAYAAVELGWILAPTRWPLLRPLADAAYRWFARHRLRLTGRRDDCACAHETRSTPG
jgi:predicted DCC family thiol-disulfide oxidoreductase YuxK